ncbi:MAG: ATP-binding protein, partial [Gammaproteobacteria bacterium]|nr:ATP-binding protein [Gammaproteobacteria bacterium]
MHEPSGALLDPATLAGMGIQQQPFEAVREDSLYLDESLELQVQMLRHNLRYSNMLQVLCGRPGAGKTTLTICLIRIANQELELFLVRGERGLTSSRIFADLLRALDCESTADSTMDVLNFTRELTAAGSVDTPAALVVDDAHLLERRELAQLLANTVGIDQGTAS